MRLIIIALILCLTAIAYADRLTDLQAERQTLLTKRQSLINDFQGITVRYQNALAETDRDIHIVEGRILENEEIDN